eukprot:scaffold141_cov123-Isochrysis_galbana.AAC.4
MACGPEAENPYRRRRSAFSEHHGKSCVSIPKHSSACPDKQSCGHVAHRSLTSSTSPPASVPISHATTPVSRGENMADNRRKRG